MDTFNISNNGYGGYYLSKGNKGYNIYCSGSQWIAKCNLDTENYEFSSPFLDNVIDWCMEQLGDD